MKRLAHTTRWIGVACVSAMALAGCVVSDGAPPSDPNAPPQQESLDPRANDPQAYDQRGYDQRPYDQRSPDDYGRASNGNPPGQAMQPGVPANVTADADRKDVPVDARLVKEGKGVMQYTAARDGLIFVVDADTDTLVFRGQINRNETFKFSPDGNAATINGHSVLKVDLKKKDKHKIFFLRD